MKTNHALAAFAESLLSSKANTWYMYGNNGHKITEAFIQTKKIQYPDNYTDAHITELRKHIGAIGYDCSSIMDVFLGKDYSANGWLTAAKTKGPISTIPEIIGLSVHYNGHVGIYVGDGKVVEARGTWYGIVETRLKDRPWKNWAKVPGIIYEEEDMILCKRGDKNESVRGVQRGLIRLGQNLGTFLDENGKPTGADGDYGPTMSAQVALFKSKHGLSGGGDLFTDADVTVLLKQLGALPKATSTGITQAQLDQEKARTKTAIQAAEAYRSDLATIAQAENIIDKYR